VFERQSRDHFKVIQKVHRAREEVSAARHVDPWLEAEGGLQAYISNANKSSISAPSHLSDNHIMTGIRLHEICIVGPLFLDKLELSGQISDIASEKKSPFRSGLAILCLLSGKLIAELDAPAEQSVAVRVRFCRINFWFGRIHFCSDIVARICLADMSAPRTGKTQPVIAEFEVVVLALVRG
jgi:hypothetical protein